MGEHRVPKQITKWTPFRRRKRGRPKITSISGIQKAMSERNLRPGDLELNGGCKLKAQDYYK